MIAIPPDATLLKIALAARRWSDAELEKARCRYVFRQAWQHMINWPESDKIGKTVLLYYRDVEHGGWYRAADDEYAENHPDVIAQAAAWKALVAARKAAGIARSVLTKMVRRWK